MVANSISIETNVIDSSVERPTRVRYGVFAFLCAVTLLLYLDRMCLGKAAPFIQKDLGLSDQEMGAVHSAFMISYGMFEVISGHWADRFGSRRVLTRIVIWWSVFTALTGAASSFTMLLAVRFLFGAGEAGALPNVARIVDQWFPECDRARMRGLVNLPALVGGMLAPVATAYLMEAIGWRSTVVVYGSLGLVWGTSFYWWFRDHPASHPQTNTAEVHLIQSIGRDADAAGSIVQQKVSSQSLSSSDHSSADHRLPWKRIFANRNVWLLSLVLICGSSTMSVVFSWYPTYLERIHGVSNIRSGWMNSGVMFGGALGCIAGGMLTERAGRVLVSARWQQSAVGTTAFAIASLALLAASFVESYGIKTALIGVMCFGVHMHAAAWWTANSRLSGIHVSAMFGLINSMGVLGGACSQYAFGMLERNQWNSAFPVGAAILCVGALCWSGVDPRITLQTHGEKS